jgi:hypothetical protein
MEDAGIKDNNRGRHNRAPFWLNLFRKLHYETIYDSPGCSTQQRLPTNYHLLIPFERITIYPYPVKPDMGKIFRRPAVGRGISIIFSYGLSF